MAINDGFGGNPVVAKAVEALSAFGGDELSHGQAARLLSMWAHVGELSAREKVAVLARFPRGCADLEHDLPVPVAETAKPLGDSGYELATGTGRHAGAETGNGHADFPASFGDLSKGAVVLPMGDDSNSGPGWPLGGER